ncbi:MAG: RidA family protein [Candidatus Dormibacteraeota bacterium]|nr:RidA family protein [Candidatus Dormibacteraeota bacterium]MDQ6922489.1 RidA family protein [Candidatus Dormibacteraeota bacterium]
MSSALQRLQDLGYELPAAPPAMASYVPTRLVPIGEGRALLFVAGQVPRRDGELMTGRVPDEVGMEQAQEAARACALNVLAQIDAAAGLEQVEQVAQLTGYVQSAAGFGEQPEVINAASDLIVEVLGEPGRHSRAAVGVNALPRGVSVEIAAVVVVRT